MNEENKECKTEGMSDLVSLTACLVGSSIILAFLADAVKNDSQPLEIMSLPPKAVS